MLTCFPELRNKRLKETLGDGSEMPSNDAGVHKPTGRDKCKGKTEGKHTEPNCFQMNKAGACPKEKGWNIPITLILSSLSRCVG